VVSRKAVRRSVPPEELPPFIPVPRQVARHDGWTPARQIAFIEGLADTGCVAIAARMVNMSPESAYQLRRQPGAESFRRAWDSAQALGLLPVKDEAFHRAMHGQLVPVFVGGKLMGFRRKKNDRLLMFILRHYGQDALGRKTTVNYFSTRAGAVSHSSPALAGEGDRAKHGGGASSAAAAEASTTTLKTVISGPAGAPSQLAADDQAAAVLNAFQGVALDEEAQARIYDALAACAERRRALENDPENDPECEFLRVPPGDLRYLGELEGGVEGDWVEYRPEGEHRWESLGEGGGAAEIDRVLAEMAARKAAMTPEEEAAEMAAIDAQIAADIEKQQKRLPPPDPDDPRLDWRNWTGGYVPPSDPPRNGEGDHARHGGGAVASAAEAGEAPISPRLRESEEPAPAKAGGKPSRRYRKRQPKPPFAPPDEARKTEAVAAVEAERREHAAAEAKRRRAKARRRDQSPG